MKYLLVVAIEHDDDLTAEQIHEEMDLTDSEMRDDGVKVYVSRVYTNEEAETVFRSLPYDPHQKQWKRPTEGAPS